MLLLFMLKLRNKKYIDKAKKTIYQIGENEQVLDILNRLLDPSLQREKQGEGYTYSSFAEKEADPVQIEALEEAYFANFTKEEQSMLKGLANDDIVYHSRTPEIFSDALGKDVVYALHGNGSEETPLNGLGDEVIMLTKEERDIVERNGGGIPLGALLFLYTVALENKHASPLIL